MLHLFGVKRVHSTRRKTLYKLLEVIFKEIIVDQIVQCTNIYLFIHINFHQKKDCFDIIRDEIILLILLLIKII